MQKALNDVNDIFTSEDMKKCPLVSLVKRSHLYNTEYIYTITFLPLKTQMASNPCQQTYFSFFMTPKLIFQ